jgi:hypothetical protein
MSFLIQCAVSILHNILVPRDLQARLSADIRPGEWLDALFAINLAVRVGIALLLVWFVWVRASRIAKWICVLFALGPLFQIQDAWTGLQSGNVNSIAWTVRQVIVTFAALCLFLPDSRHWFASKGRSVQNDASVFE